jgi:hypothetical protein
VVDEGSGAGLGLVEFLADLRSDLEAARDAAAAQGGDLRLGVEEVTVTLEVAHERTTSGELGGKVTGKFWVFGSAEAAGKAGREARRSGTQTLTLTLKPRVETTTVDEQGRTTTVQAGLDVHGRVGAGEQQPPPPSPAQDHGHGDN